MKTPYLYAASALLTLSVFAFSSPARADADDASKEAATFDADASAHGGVRVNDAIADRFSIFAGSEDNATALVTGLRSGSAITLTSTVNGQTTTTTFTPATGQQGYGNVFLSLSLAQQELAAQGITNPTSAQIQAALDGGSVTIGTGADAKTVQLDGVLKLRASGEGWGQIANQLGVKLGRLVSDLRSERENIQRRDRDHDTSRADHDMVPEKMERPEHPEQIERPERPERPELLERPEKPELPERPSHG